MNTMSQSNAYHNKLGENAIKQVVDDLVNEKIAGVTGRTGRTSYDKQLACLAAMGVGIKRNALYQRVDRQIKAIHPSALAL